MPKLRVVKNLPKDPDYGQKAMIVRKGRKLTMQATGQPGFGKWQIIKNEKAL